MKAITRKQEIINILSDVTCSPYNFEIIEKENQEFLVANYLESDILTNKESVQKTRKWYISPWATKSEIIQTALKCVLTSMEHRAREAFTYKGKRVYGPHFNVDALWEICNDRKFDYRPANKQDGVEDAS